MITANQQAEGTLAKAAPLSKGVNTANKIVGDAHVENNKRTFSRFPEEISLEMAGAA